MNSVLGLLAWLTTILGGPAPCDSPRVHRGDGDAPVMCLPPPPSNSGAGPVGEIRGGQAVSDINNGL